MAVMQKHGGCGAFLIIPINLNMKTKYTIAILLLTVVIANISLWIYTTTQQSSFLESQAAYFAYFPKWLAGYTTHIGIVFLGIAIPIFAMAVQNNYRKNISIVLMALSILLFVWQIFTLM